jgi:predicted phage-related endonuclease
MGWKFGDLACLVGNRAFEVFSFERHERLIAKILERVGAFWEHVRSGTPPQVDGTISTAQTLATLHPNDSGEEVEASIEVVDAVRKLQAVNAEIKGMKDDKAFLENRIKASMGNATFARGPGFVVSWKTSERKGFEVKPSTVRTMRINMKGNDNE